MADCYSKETRTKTMRSVKSRDNKSTELRLIDFFKSNNIKGWRRNYKLYGKPDFVFPKLKIVVFTDGCFWHGHDCRNLTPKQNSDYWSKKITKNKIRDIDVSEKLSKSGWSVVRIWECELKRIDVLREKFKLWFFNEKI